MPERIDRSQLVARHRVRLQEIDPLNPLTVGNGEFAFTADVTGLQTFPERYSAGVPLCTMSQWGWHTTPPGPEVDPESVRYTDFDTHGRPVPYLVDAKGQEATFNWLRQNPHRLHLGQIGLCFRSDSGQAVTPADLSKIEQVLDPWNGLLQSAFEFDGRRVTVETCCAGESDAIGVRIRSTLLADGRLAVRWAFPYGSPTPAAADWEKAAAHRTTLREMSENRVILERELDQTKYYVTLQCDTPSHFKESWPHEFRLRARGGETELSFVCGFSREPALAESTFESARQASARFWETYWQSGAAVDFAGSTDPRAAELERRIVLSQYLMRANCAGSLPPAETGLTCNSWYGKFHLEMHWWHGVHFALWDRLPLLERSLGFYQRTLPEAKKIARHQGYAGARWPKMVDPKGIDSPSPIGPLLLWQQPHPIYYAELCYRRYPTLETVRLWDEIVDQTADFMAAFAVAVEGQSVLGPPIKSMQENNDTTQTRNPTFELTYWRWGLAAAQEWRQRGGRSRKPQWDAVLERLAPAPVKDGMYLYHDDLAETYTQWNWEHPAMLGALGMLPGDGIDPEVMRRSVEKVMQVWQWDRCWGWDFPMTAMCAARCNRPDLAVDALFIESAKNRFGSSGHVYQRPDLCLYLPANGGLLAAVAMMVGGWDGAAEVETPGFPRSGWTIRHEGFRQMP